MQSKSEARTQPASKAASQGYLPHKKMPPLQDFRRAPGLGLLQGPRGVRFLISEAPLQCTAA